MSWIERAYVGQKIVCVRPNEHVWIGTISGPTTYAPRLNEICEITEIVSNHDGIYLALAGYGSISIFHQRWFKPVKDTTLQVEALKRICLNTPERVG